MTSRERDFSDFDFIGPCDVFAETAAAAREVHPDVLGDMVNTLMTELWDRNFSQTEIRQAFEDALADMNRYAAGEERRP